MKKFLCLLIAIAAGPAAATAQRATALSDHYESEWRTFREFVKLSQERGNADTTFNVTFYDLKAEVSIDPNNRYIRGNLLCRFTSRVDGLAGIILSLQHALQVDSITGHAASYSVSGDSIRITLDRTYGRGETAQVRVWYQGVPQLAGGYKGLRYETHHSGEPVIATLSTPYLAHYWYPCKDGPEDKADSVYLDITVPDTSINGNKVIAVSNGLLENVLTENGKTTYSWRHRYPIVTYYVMMAISNYTHFQQSFAGQGGESFPIDYYVFRENDSVSQAGVSDMPEVMQFYSDMFGKYPFRKEKYAMTQLGYYGAIENQTNTITNRMDLSWFDVSIHELSHMWFGDMITCADWHHAWLNEGFATYAEALWVEHKSGPAAYRAYLNSTPGTMGGTLYLQDDLDTFNIFQPIVYYKGSWVLHMLRGVLGDVTFFQCLRAYASSPGFMYKNATTDDFRHLVETVSGRDLTTFFDQWVYDAYYPKYHYNYKQDSVTKVLTLHIYQAQANLNKWREVFEMPLQIRITDSTGYDTLFTVMNNQLHQEYQFQLTGTVPHDAASVVIDPDKWVIRINYFKPAMPVGIPEAHGSGMTFNLYPCPTSELIYIDCPQAALPVPYDLFDRYGARVRGGFLETPVSPVDIRDLPEGLYLVRLRDGNYPTCKKFLKQ